MEKRTFSGAGTHACRAPLVALPVLACCLTSANDALSRALAADFAVPAARDRIQGAEARICQNRTTESFDRCGSRELRWLRHLSKFELSRNRIFFPANHRTGQPTRGSTDVARPERGTTRAPVELCVSSTFSGRVKWPVLEFARVLTRDACRTAFAPALELPKTAIYGPPYRSQYERALLAQPRASAKRTTECSKHLDVSHLGDRIQSNLLPQRAAVRIW